MCAAVRLEQQHERAAAGRRLETGSGSHVEAVHAAPTVVGPTRHVGGRASS